MAAYDIRLIVMDMDGTLLNADQRISPGNAQALQQARMQGIHLAICSGRSPGDIALFALENGLEDCALLALNGTYCLRSPLADSFSEHVLPEETLKETIRIIRDEKQAFACYAQNRVVVCPQNKEDGHTFFVTHDHGLMAPEVLYGEEGLAHVWRRGVNKIINLAPDQESWERTRKRLLEVPGLDVSTSWPLDFELMPQGFGKGSAVCELAQMLQISMDQVMTFGDYDNDESMIACAGLGVAMANATECIKRAAKLVTLSNDEDGVADAIRKYALKT